MFFCFKEVQRSSPVKLMYPLLPGDERQTRRALQGKSVFWKSSLSFVLSNLNRLEFIRKLNKWVIRKPCRECLGSNNFTYNKNNHDHGLNILSKLLTYEYVSYPLQMFDSTFRCPSLLIQFSFLHFWIFLESFLSGK